MRWYSLSLAVCVLAASQLGCAGGEDTNPSTPIGDATAVDDATDTEFNLDGTGCTPKTCSQLGFNCGPIDNGCGTFIDCGTCTAPEFCGGGGPSVCGTTPCTPKKCADVPADCGKQSDGCGKLMECGTCVAPKTCGGGGVPNFCGTRADTGACTPKTCAEMGYDCGPVADGCGGLAECGKCTTGTCGGGGSPNKCGSSTGPCVKKTCLTVGANCGPVSDGCGGLTPSCGTCVAPNTCGGGGTPSVCGGAPGPCTKKTCADYPTGTCGPVSDGCGGLTASCGACTPPQSCGGSGVPSRCGAAGECVRKTCADHPAGTCGVMPDGCGGLTSSCGTCTAPQICGGGGVPSQCGGGVPPCVNLECKQTTCPTGSTTSISGFVYDPAGLRPLPNVFVYVPNAPVAPLKSGATCDKCAAALSGFPLVQTISDGKGAFKLTNMPVGTDIPVVVQIGKWRRQFKVTTNRCADTVVPAYASRLPRNKGEGDIPKIALATGGADPLECLLRKVGISDSEFTNPEGTGRVNLFTGAKLVTTPPSAPTSAYAGSGGVFPDASQLWNRLDPDPSAVPPMYGLRAYDVVLLACEGAPDNKPPSALNAMQGYTNTGGRVFAEHWHFSWMKYGPNPWPSMVSWAANPPGIYEAPAKETVLTGFPKGVQMSDWMKAVGAANTATPSVFNVYNGRLSIESVDDRVNVTRWVQAPRVSECSNITCTLPGATHTNADQYISFNTPVGASGDSVCGRFVFSDIHVSSGGSGTDNSGPAFPTGCVTTVMTPQELALEYMFFDLASRVCDEKVPPPDPVCVKRTCAEQGYDCGPAPDGCGGVISSCGTCASPLICSTGGKCATSSCAPKKCSDYGYDCGSWADGCGGTVTCGVCSSPATCGGGGATGKCGVPSCAPKKCSDYGYNCGSWADGCGGTLSCGTCTAPASCGGGGTVGVCGGTCTKKTCSELGVSCGPSGDGCGGTIDCGPCDAGPGCVPLTCGGRCGPQGDGCGAVLTCPPCDGGTCTPTTCEKAGAECGSYPDGCGGLLNCGMCPSPKSCGAGGPNKCGTIG